MKHAVVFSSEVREETGEWERLLGQVIPAALDAEGVTLPCEVDVLFTDDTGIREINGETRQMDVPTDVLSFPLLALSPGEKPGKEEMDLDSGLVPLGDMVISLERARAQGEEYGHGIRRELGYLAVHSVLHLLGYDHTDEGEEKAKMRQREETILTALGLFREEERGEGE